MQRLRIYAAVALLGMAGCAGIKVGPANARSKGIRYYQSSPYLLVTTDNEGGLKSELVFLPDRNKPLMSARPYSALAKNDTTLEFDNGVLKTGESEADSAAIPKAVLSALEKAATAAIAAAALNAPVNAEPRRVPGPLLFRIDIQPSKIRLVGPDGEVDPGSTTDVYVKDPPPRTPSAPGDGK